METDISPKVIVLILSYNGKGLLQDSVSSYLANDYQNFKVIVIDNGSVDNTKEYVEKEFPDAKVIRIEKNKGYSGGFNVGLNYAFNQQKADYVVITNNDVKVDSKVISSLVETAQNYEKAGFVTGKVYYFDSPNTLQTVGKLGDPVFWKGGHIGNKQTDIGQFDKECELDFADDIFILVSHELYSTVGGFDPDFFLQGEEFDWQARAKNKGFKFYYTPYAKIWHKESMTIGKDSLLKLFYDSRNPMIVIAKHKDARFFKRYFWKRVFYLTLKSSSKEILALNLKRAFTRWRGVISGLNYCRSKKLLTLKHFI